MFGFFLAGKLRLNQAEVLEILIKDEIPLSRVRYENPDAISFTVKGLTEAEVVAKLDELFGQHYRVRRIATSGDKVIDVFHLKLPERQLNMLLPELDLQRLSDGTFLRAFERLGIAIRRGAINATLNDIQALASRRNSLQATIKLVSEELSELQKGYQDFFKDKLADQGVNSPADLSEEDKRDFFNDIEKTWPAERKDIMTQATLQQPVALTALHKQDANTYLLKLTGTQSMPTRQQIVAWCKKNGVSIDASNIRLRTNVIRVQATAGEMKVKPAAGLIAALQDTTPEVLLAEVGDKLIYAHHGIRATGVVKGYSAHGLIMANDTTGEQNEIALSAILKVQGYQVDEAQALSAEAVAAKSLGL